MIKYEEGGQMQKADVTIIGAGVNGTVIARELSKYKLKVLLLEKNAEVGLGMSARPAGWIQAGFGWEGVLRNKLIGHGGRMLPQLMKKLDLPLSGEGSLTVGRTKDNGQDLEDLKMLLSGAEYYGIKGLRIIEGKELREMEPNLSREFDIALYAPMEVAFSPWELVIALMENAKENGVEVLLNTKVENIYQNSINDIIIETNRGSIRSRYTVNAAGVWADVIARMVDKNFPPVDSFEGADQWIMDKRARKLVNHVIYDIRVWIGEKRNDSSERLDVPAGFIGGEVDDTLLFSYAPSDRKSERDDLSTSRYSLQRTVPLIKRLLPTFSPKDIIRYFSAVVPIREDFIIGPSKTVPHLINVQMDYPGNTCAPATAKLVTKILANQGLKLVKNSRFDPYRKAIPKIRELSDEKKKELVAGDKRYGHIVCRCEHVSEGEIVEAINRGARTLDGIKYRTRAGMGRCQGGFCSPRVLQILSRELNVPLTEITKRGKGSELLMFKTKELLVKKGNFNE